MAGALEPGELNPSGEGIVLGQTPLAGLPGLIAVGTDPILGFYIPTEVQHSSLITARRTIASGFFPPVN
jgi:hypothetical protein